MNPFTPILLFGLVLLGTRLMEVYFPPLAAHWLFQLGSWWDHHFRERRRRQTPPEPPMPNSRGRPRLGRQRSRTLPPDFSLPRSFPELAPPKSTPSRASEESGGTPLDARDESLVKARPDVENEAFIEVGSNPCLAHSTRERLPDSFEAVR